MLLSGARLAQPVSLTANCLGDISILTKLLQVVRADARQDIHCRGYRRAGIEARVEPFLFAMDREIKAADLVVCRAGATTIAELTAAGRPSVLVPLPTATDDHQRKNAEVLGAAGAAEVVEQTDLGGGALATRIRTLVNAPDRLAAMAAAARKLGRPDAVKVIADKAIELIERK